jgi:hypothetical protein
LTRSIKPNRNLSNADQDKFAATPEWQKERCSEFEQLRQRILSQQFKFKNKKTTIINNKVKIKLDLKN